MIKLKRLLSEEWRPNWIKGAVSNKTPPPEDPEKELINLLKVHNWNYQRMKSKGYNQGHMEEGWIKYLINLIDKNKAKSIWIKYTPEEKHKWFNQYLK